MSTKIFEIEDSVYEYYRTKIRNNEDCTRDLAMRKLTRNWMIGKTAKPKEGTEGVLRFYGNLALLVKNDKIVWIHSYNDHQSTLHIDWKLKHELDKEFGLLPDIQPKEVEVEEVKVEYEGIGMLHKIKKLFNIA